MLIDVPCMCVCIFRWRERCCAGDRPSRGFSCAYIERDVRQHCQDAMMCRCIKAPTEHGLYQCRQSLDVRAWLKPMQLHACSFLLSLAEAVVLNVTRRLAIVLCALRRGHLECRHLPCTWSFEFLRELWMRIGIFFQHLVPQLTARNPTIGFQGTSGFVSSLLPPSRRPCIACAQGPTVAKALIPCRLAIRKCRSLCQRHHPRNVMSLLSISLL